jgi:acetyl esterase/lipase
MQNSEYILTEKPPAADKRLNYCEGEFHFGDLRLPHGKPPFPAVMFIHGGFWRAKYDLAHAGFFCAALAKAGFVTWSIEYRRVGNPGGGWPGSFEDVASAYQYLRQVGPSYAVDLSRILVIGHSAGGQLALALAAHRNSMKAAVSLAGVVDLRRAWDLHLSNDAVGEFLGGPADKVPEHYREASPAECSIHTPQILIHGAKDDTVPVQMSRDYAQAKKKKGEDVKLVELPNAGHFEVIDPRAKEWRTILEALNEQVLA